MCDPVTAAAVASTAISAYGTAQQSAISQAQMNYEADMMAYNAKIAENNALMAEQAAEYEADTFDLEARRVLARQRVGYANSGVVIDQDTPLDMSADTAAEAELERLAILYKGETQAEAFRQQAKGQESAAAAKRLGAKLEKRSGQIATLGEIAKGGYTTSRYQSKKPGTSLLRGD